MNASARNDSVCINLKWRKSCWSGFSTKRRDLDFDSRPWLAERPRGACVMLEGSGVEQYESNFVKVSGFFERVSGTGHCYSRGLIHGIAVRSSRDRGECNGRELQLIRDADGFAMATGQRLGFATVTPAPERADGVNDILRDQPAGGRGNRLSRGKATDAPNNLFAGFENRGASGAMDCAVHTSSAQQRRVGGVHDGVGLLASDISRACDQEDAAAEIDSQNLRTVVHDE